jgi:phenylalanyl-tRNA synthetase beta chain
MASGGATTMKYSFKLGQSQSSVDLCKILKLSKAELAEKLNSQIGAFDEIIDWGARYDGVYLVKVVSVNKHPDADKLSVCLIDDNGAAKAVERNEQGLVQVVCGAPNVKEDILVPWISPGTTVPSSLSDKEPFILSKIKLRGVESNGMLASPRELQMGDLHEGILIIDSKDHPKRLLKTGTNFKELYDLDDIIVDFENKMFTHRPDCFGQIGIAREIAGIQSIKFESPEWYLDLKPTYPEANSDLKLQVENKVPNLTQRYMGVVIEGIKIEPSPLWLQIALTKLGIRPISNIVDITNYMMSVTAQPMHAFDYDKVAQKANVAQIIVRKAKKDETLTIIGGKTIKLDPTDIVIADSKQAIALGGVMGGADSEISDSTTKIILESAVFDMYVARRTSMRHGLFSEAVTRFTKGQNHYQTAPVLAEAIKMIQELFPESKIGQVCDVGMKIEHRPIPPEVSTEQVNNLLGTEFKESEVAKILELVEIPSHNAGGMLCVNCENNFAFWRQDLAIAEDIIEEVGRLYGFNKIKAKLPTRASSPARSNSMIELKNEIRRILSSHGANEVLTYNFVNADLLTKAKQDPKMAFKIRNALSPDLQHYRMSLIPNLIEKVHSNLKAGEDNLAIFEIGKTHLKNHLAEDGLPKEFQRLSFVFASSQKESGSPFYVAKSYLNDLLNSLNLEFKFIELGAEMFGNKIPVTSVYKLGHSAGVEINGQISGVVGEFDTNVAKNFKLPPNAAGFELDLDLPVENFNLSPNYQELNKFPEVSQDLTLERSDSVKYSELEHELSSAISSQTDKKGIQFSLELKDIFQKTSKDPKNFTFGITFWHSERTLTTKEVTKIVEGVK